MGVVFLLSEKVLDLLNRLVSAYLDLAKINALNMYAMTMKELLKELDRFLTITHFGHFYVNKIKPTDIMRFYDLLDIFTGTQLGYAQITTIFNFYVHSIISHNRNVGNAYEPHFNALKKGKLLTFLKIFSLILFYKIFYTSINQPTKRNTCFFSNLY